MAPVPPIPPAPAPPTPLPPAPPNPTWPDPEKNPFIQGGGNTTLANPPAGDDIYGGGGGLAGWFDAAEPIPLYPAPRPCEILPTRLIYPGVLSSPQSRLQPVPGNPVIFAANQAWYNSLGVANAAGGGGLVSGVGGAGGADPIPSVPGPWNSQAPLYQPYVQWNIQNVMWLGVWVNISAYFEKAAGIELFGSVELGTDNGLAYTAIEGNAGGILDRARNYPLLTSVDGAGYFGWMGCRSTWPCTQQCWYIGLLCGLEKYGVAIIAVVLLLFELFLMEGIIVTDFIAVVPKTATWADFFTADVPVTPRIATAFVYLIFWLLLLGFCFNKLSPQSYFRQLGGGRILLRSLAANFEAQSYSYCNMIFWTILFEFDTVIIPAYFPFVLTLLVTETYEGNIREAAVLLLIFFLVANLHSMAIYIVELLACIPEWLIDPTEAGTAATGPGANDYVRGSRVDVELNSMNYIYLWTTGLGFLIMLILMKLQMTMLYLWFVPLIIAWYCLAWQTIPYCLQGWPVCPTHTGPCITMTAIATTLIFIAIFIFHHACFLVPCLCAPEVPGYLFFPSSGVLESPLSGKFDISYELFLRRIGATDAWDCAWIPPAELSEIVDEVAARRLAEGVVHSPLLGFFTELLAGWP